MRKIIEETDQKNATLELHLRAQSGYSADEKVKISPNQWGKIVRIITQEKMERVREIIKEYEDLPNNAGAFASGMMKFSIKNAENSMAIGDTIGTMKALNDLKEYEL